MRAPRTLAVVALVGASALAQAPAPPAPARKPVLAQVKVPHPYYWREMYVPQVTSGPSAAAWSPDGAELVYAMQGSLWRQKVGSDEARQLTAGPGYDHQPDWSPDGRFVVYSSYHDDALELRILDLGTGASTALVQDGAVNLDARFSPDGRRLAWVSTSHEGRWHVFVADFMAKIAAGVNPAAGAKAGGKTPPPAPPHAEGAGLGFASAPVRVTEDRDSGLPRYYYSRFDHYLSPSWSPDGAELILVSNRGRIQGTGGLWRMPARPGASMRELHYEETTWKARPDWCRDGRRVVYASYQGRQWHQLWLTTAAGGDPFPLTYGEHDATSPRWSPDGSRIAYVSNEDGNTSLWVVDVPGGRRQPVAARRRVYAGPVGRLEIALVEAGTGRRLPARVSVTGGDSRAFTPDDAWRHADEAFVRGEQRFEHVYFHAEDRATLTVPAGEVSVQAWRGPEYGVAQRLVTVPADGLARTRLELPRLADLTLEGRWGADLHVHMNYGGAYRNTPKHLALQARAEGLHAVENLVVNKEQRIPDVAAFRTDPDPASRPGLLLVHGQEFHTSFWGHIGLLGLRDHYLLPDYAGYPHTAAASLAPTNARVADLAHEQGALVGYVHPFDGRPDPDRPTESRALPVDVALGKVDYLEVMGFSDHLVTSEVWYRLLNCGFRLPAGAGTDAFPNFASLRGPAGLVRAYVKAGPRLSRRALLDGLARGRTFVTNAPLLWFTIEGREPGETFALGSGTKTLNARVRILSAVPVDHLEVIGNGRVVATVPLARRAPDATRAAAVRTEAQVSLPVTGSGWYVLRAWSERPHLPVLDLYPFASTSPIYVDVDGAPVRSPTDAAYFARWISALEEAVRAHADWNTSREREAALGDLARARGEFERRGRE